MKTSYAPSDRATEDFADLLEYHVLEGGIRKILEVGGGANPQFSIEFVRRHGLEYTVLDISEAELAKAPAGYLKIHADIASPALELLGEYDLVFSKMLAEHVRSGEVFHRNIHRLLKRGGVAVHLFPTLYALPFIANRLLPERLAGNLLHRLQSGRHKSGRNAKFPAYYSWCRGPTRRQVQKYESLDYDVSIVGYFGHGWYYERLPVIRKVHHWIRNWLLSYPLPLLTSFARVSLTKR